MEGSMQHNVIAVRAWNRAFDSEIDSASLECVCLFSLFGLAVSAAVLLFCSPEAVAAMTTALM
jgi:hypothetical protein